MAPSSGAPVVVGLFPYERSPGMTMAATKKVLDAAPQCCVLVSPDTHSSEVWQMFSSMYVDKHRELSPWQTGEGVGLVHGCPIDCLAALPEHVSNDVRCTQCRVSATLGAKLIPSTVCG